MASETRKRKCKYVPTSKDKNTLRRWKRGESIGFSATASLKAKGMIPRSCGKRSDCRYCGKKIVSAKYCGK